MIPKILHFSLPPAHKVSERVWRNIDNWEKIHTGWEIFVWMDPLNPEQFPLTNTLWQKCIHPVQISGVTRLEAVYTHGGFYVDSDVECLRSIHPLCDNQFIVGQQDESFPYYPDAFFGSVAGGDVLGFAIDRVLHMDMKSGLLSTGPANMTEAVLGILKQDENFYYSYCLSPRVTILPIKAIYPYSYTEKHRAGEDFSKDPEVYAVHRWDGSWCGKGV